MGSETKNIYMYTVHMVSTITCTYQDSYAQTQDQVIYCAGTKTDQMLVVEELDDDGGISLCRNDLGIHSKEL